MFISQSIKSHQDAFRQKVLIMAALLMNAVVCAQTYQVRGFSVDGAGGRSQDATFTLFGAIGQPEGDENLSGGGFSMTGGFLPSGAGAHSSLATWACAPNGGNWSTTACWTGLNASDQYPNNAFTNYTVTLPSGGYTVTQNLPAITIGSLQMSNSGTTLQNTSDHQLTVIDGIVGSGRLLATGDNSRVQFPNFQELAGPDTGALLLEAASNDRIDLPALTSITGLVQLSVHNDSTDSTTINCPSLDHLSTGTTLSVSVGGRFLGAPLIDIHGAQVTKHSPDAELDTSHITNIDDAILLADGGATLAFPLITSYTAFTTDCPQPPATVGRSLASKNPNSQLIFPALAVLNNTCATGNIRLQTYRSSGQPASGEIHMPALNSMIGRVDIFADASLMELGMADLAPTSLLHVNNSAELRILGSMRHAITNPNLFDWSSGGALSMYGGHSGNCATLEIACKDFGNSSSGWTSNMQLNTLKIGPGAHVQLVDQVNNNHRGGAGGSAEALYVETLQFVDAAARLDLGGLHLYYHTLVGNTAQITNSGCACPGDLDENGTIDLSDLAISLSHYGMQSGATYGDGDLDGDGDVDLSDIAGVLSVYGSNCQ